MNKNIICQVLQLFPRTRILISLILPPTYYAKSAWFQHYQYKCTTCEFLNPQAFLVNNESCRTKTFQHCTIELVALASCEFLISNYTWKYWMSYIIELVALVVFVIFVFASCYMHQDFKKYASANITKYGISFEINKLMLSFLVAFDYTLSYAAIFSFQCFFLQILYVDSSFRMCKPPTQNPKSLDGPRSCYLRLSRLTSIMMGHLASSRGMQKKIYGITITVQFYSACFCYRKYGACCIILD